MNREFTVSDAYNYDSRSPSRWLASHVRRHLFFILSGLVCWIAAFTAFSMIQVMIGRAMEDISDGVEASVLLGIAFTIFLLASTDGLSSLLGGYSMEKLSKGIARDVRRELYISLLGKSQVYHDRQRTGDIMARATEDVQGIKDMFTPGFLFIFDVVIGIIVPMTFIAFMEPKMLLVPGLFVVVYVWEVRRYVRKLNPIIESQREQFGTMNAGLEETISGIEIVKGSAQEAFERAKFRRNAHKFREYFLQQGRIESRYLPLLMFAVAMGLQFMHGVLLYRSGQLSIPTLIAVMGLMNVLRFPVFISIFAWSVMQNGMNSAKRILTIIQAQTDLDENVDGYKGTLEGNITFENVSFGYEDGMILENLSFEVKAGQTIAIVGQTGSGKSTLTQLVNRTYDVTTGRILIDGIDVREWSLDALRSQISKIEQDIFLFTRSVSENIAFGAPDTAQHQIEAVAQEAQAHDFIQSFTEGYGTKIGERGVTLSGGQRQRIALARAFLSGPRILILDDSTSAIDSKTEDEIQKALKKAQQGRTVLLITHRLSQIRWADRILVLDQGKIVGNGTHEELLKSSSLYRRIFARYDVALLQDQLEL
jgi:ATP-binding cassette subfamily B protein